MEKSGTGKRIKELLNYFDLSQSAFARAIGTQPQTVSSYINNNMGISSEILLKIKNAYNVNPEWVMHGHGPMLLSESKIDETSSINESPKGGSDTISILLNEIEYLKALLVTANQEKQQLLEVLSKQSGNLFSSRAKYKLAA